MMNLSFAGKTLRKGAIFLTKNSTKILTALAIAGVVKVAFEVNRVAPKAHEELEAIKDEAKQAANRGEKQSSKPEAEAIVKRVLPLYIPTMIYSALTIAAILGAYGAGVKKQAAIASLYALSESNFERYRENIVKTIGEKKEKKVVEQAAIDQAVTAKKNSQVILCGKGKILFFEPISGRYFESTREEVMAAVNEVNRLAIAYDSASMRDFYNEIGLEPTLICDDQVWVPDHMLDLSFGAYMADDGEPALTLIYNQLPTSTFK